MYSQYETKYLAELEVNEEEELPVEDESSRAKVSCFTDFEAFGRPSNASMRGKKRRRVESTQLQAY